MQTTAPHITTYSSREFTRDVSDAKKATADGPVFITDRGRPAYALLKIEDYYQMAAQEKTSFLDAMDAIAGGQDFEFEPPRLQLELPAADLG